MTINGIEDVAECICLAYFGPSAAGGGGEWVAVAGV